MLHVCTYVQYIWATSADPHDQLAQLVMECDLDGNPDVTWILRSQNNFTYAKINIFIAS